jgi:hypothetical protein
MTNYPGFSAEERALIRGTQIASEKLPSLWWRFVVEKRFVDPFFTDTLRGMEKEQQLSCQTPFSALAQIQDYLAPTAFIFHVSRCGSTLLTQSLASLPQCIVMSEPPIIDSFLRLHHADPDQSGAEHRLRQLIAGLGQRRFGNEQKFFIKLDSWHIHDLPLIRKAFPATPCIFLYRQPVEVLASHARQRGPQMVPGLIDPARLQLDTETLHPADLEGYGIQVLKHFFKSALQHALSDELVLMNYKQLPQFICSHVLPFFSITCTPSEIAIIEDRLKFHSKNRTTAFNGDPQPAHAAICEQVDPYYDRLEQLRIGQNHFQPAG